MHDKGLKLLGPFAGAWCACFCWLGTEPGPDINRFEHSAVCFGMLVISLQKLTSRANCCKNWTLRGRAAKQRKPATNASPAPKYCDAGIKVADNAHH